MRTVSAGIDDFAFASTSNFCPSFSALPVVGAGEEAFQDREGTAAASSPAVVTAAMKTNSLMLNKRSNGGISIGMVGQATVDATLAEGRLMGISNPSQRQLQGFQKRTDYLMPNNITSLQSHGERNSLENYTSHARRSGAGVTPTSDQSGGGPGFLCHVCGIRDADLQCVVESTKTLSSDVCRVRTFEEEVSTARLDLPHVPGRTTGTQGEVSTSSTQRKWYCDNGKPVMVSRLL